MPARSYLPLAHRPAGHDSSNGHDDDDGNDYNARRRDVGLLEKGVPLSTPLVEDVLPLLLSSRHHFDRLGDVKMLRAKSLEMHSSRGRTVKRASKKGPQPECLWDGGLPSFVWGEDLGGSWERHHGPVSRYGDGRGDDIPSFLLDLPSRS